MDWSLVLVSQGIEPVIDRSPDNGTWVLVVSAEESERATAAIRAYEKENATIWRREIQWTGMLFDWRSAFWWFVVVLVSGAAWDLRPALTDAGIMNFRALLAGQWWRAFTAMTLHADLDHLARNASVGFLLLGLAMGFYGPGRALLAALLAGAGANAIEALFRHGSEFGLGASGMVMACLGLLAAQSLFERHYSAREWIGRGVLAAALLFVLIGLDARSDIAAHVFGLFNGFVLGIVLCLTRNLMRRIRWVDGAAALASAAIVLGAWARAIKG